MASRRHFVLVALGIWPMIGASYATRNFVVEAPTPQIAQHVGQYAEYYRKQKAVEWLGQEMADWPEPCPLKVKVTMSGPGGATSFAFDRGQVLGQNMHIEGPLERLVNSVLPHEVTHTVFAYYFRRPVPRWADEGGAVLSEDDWERDRHDRLVRQILNTPGRKIPLRRLFSLHDYPGDVMVLYAEGFSVSNFLVSLNNRQTFLAFVQMGMSQNGWDYAARSYYRFNSVEELEEAWLANLRAARRQAVQVARNNVGAAPPDAANRVVVRQTVPPSLLAPVYRGQSGEGDPATPHLTTRPGYLPDYNPAAGPSGIPETPPIAMPENPWHPRGQPTSTPPSGPRVQLGSPEAATTTPPSYGQALPPAASPVGYPR